MGEMDNVEDRIRILNENVEILKEILENKWGKSVNELLRECYDIKKEDNNGKSKKSKPKRIEE